jgi:hypothetical protein
LEGWWLAEPRSGVTGGRTSWGELSWKGYWYCRSRGRPRE